MVMIKCHYCKEEISKKEDIEIKKVNGVNRKFHKDKKCYDNYTYEEKYKCKYCGELITKNEDYEEIPEIENGFLHDRCIDSYNEWKKDKDDWDKLYRYVKDNILEYKENMNLSKYQVMRLRGLRDSKYITRKGDKVQKTGYPYHIIYLTFLFKSNDILYALKTKTFKDDCAKFDYIMVIVENSINGIYIRVSEQDKANSRLEQTSKRILERKVSEPIENNSEMEYTRSNLKTNVLKALEDDGDGFGI